MLPSIGCPVDLVVFWCGHRSAIAALTPKPLWDCLQRMRIHMGESPLRGEKRFYWGAADSDWSGGVKP